MKARGRPGRGFAAIVERIAANRARTITVEQSLRPGQAQIPLQITSTERCQLLQLGQRGVRKLHLIGIPGVPGNHG